MRLARGAFDAMPLSVISDSTVSALCALAHVPGNELRCEIAVSAGCASGACLEVVGFVAGEFGPELQGCFFPFDAEPEGGEPGVVGGFGAVAGGQFLELLEPAGVVVGFGVGPGVGPAGACVRAQGDQVEPGEVGPVQRVRGG